MTKADAQTPPKPSQIVRFPSRLLKVRARDLVFRVQAERRPVRGGAGGRNADGVLPSGGDRPGGGPPRRGGLAGRWLPDFVRLGELERHLGEGVIAAVAAKGRTAPRCGAAARGTARAARRV